MKRMINVFIVLMLGIGVPIGAFAGEFDGEKELLCCFTKVMECLEVEGCQERTPEQVNLPQFVDISFAQKLITPSRGGENQRKTEIERMEHIDGKLIIEGAEDGVEGVRDGFGWSMAISEETGRLVGTVSGEGVGFVIFGACTPR
jgi:hypothetical protein